MADPNERLDALNKNLADLIGVLREHRTDPATLDADALAQEVERIAGERVDALLAKTPARRLEGEAHPPVEALPVANRYDELLKAKAVQPVDLYLAKRLLDGASALSGGNKRPASKDLADTVQKLMTATGSGAGDELVPTGMAAAIWQDMFLQARIASLVTRVPMPTDPFKANTLGDPTWRKGVSGEAVSASDLATGNATFTSTEQVAEVDWGYDLDEDAAVAMMPNVRENITRTGAEQMDAFILNADSTTTASTNINLIDGTPDTDDYYLSSGEDGIRHLWLVDNTGQANNAGGDALADADMSAMLQDLGKYGVDPLYGVITCDAKTYLAMARLTNVATVDKYGAQATILTGELGRYAGIPVVPSSQHPLAQATGKVGSSSNTLGSVSAFARPMWGVGFRRELLIEVDRDIQKRAYIMVASFRIAVACRGTRSSSTHAAGIYNVLV